MKWKHRVSWGYSSYRCEKKHFRVDINETMSRDWTASVFICNELIWIYPGFETKDKAIAAVRSVLWQLNDEIYGQISAKDFFEEA